MRELRDCLTAGALDIILIPAVTAMPRFEHRVADVEPMVEPHRPRPAARRRRTGHAPRRALAPRRTQRLNAAPPTARTAGTADRLGAPAGRPLVGGHRADAGPPH
ncbi:hypothetical protein [Streptomyces fungicidicus]|uniref:hypothetical protein n=1 Tax=Streptomyces fungicidicus TaxID=68203 RepID=UPI003829383B